MICEISLDYFYHGQAIERGTGQENYNSKINTSFLISSI